MDNQRLISFVQDLIRQPSLSGEEGPVIQRIAAEMTALGFGRVWVDESGSAIGLIEGDLPGPTLLLDGHCDVVPAIPSDWLHPPFAAEITNGTLYGRGVADMKAALGAMIHAAAGVDRRSLRGRVAVSATISEEVMEGIALQAVLAALQPAAVIIGEATGFTLNRGGRGRAEIVAETFGRSAHSSSPQAGLCAVHEMIRLMQRVEAAPMPVHSIVGSAQMVLTDIISEPFPGHSVVPNRCRVTYDRRLVPGETPESVLAALQALPGLENIQFKFSVLDGVEKTWTGKTLRGLKFFPAWSFEESHPLVQAALGGLQAAGFSDTRLGAYGFCTNGASSAGIARIPTLGFGPGAETDAHTVDEHMQIEHIERAAAGYAGMIRAILS